MPHKITYSAHIGPEDNKFGMREVIPSKAIIVSDNVSSDFTLTTLEQDDSSAAPKRVFDVSSSARKTRVLSNTTDVYMSNVFEDGSPLYFKVSKKVSGYSKVLIDGVEHSTSDVNFIYTNSASGKIEYLDEDGKIILTEEGEFFPVFIWEGMRHLEDIIAKDNRKFTYSVNKGKILISASKPGIVAEVDDEPIFKLRRDKGLRFYLKPFIHRVLKGDDNRRLIFEYDYSRLLPNLRTVSHETSTVIDRHYIDLSNSRVVKDSIEIIILDKKTKQEFMRISNSGGSMDNHNVNATDGTINIKNFLSVNDIDVDDYVFISSYMYLSFEDLSVEVDSKNYDLKNRVIYFDLSPTLITKDDINLEFDQNISYTVTNNDGSIVTTSNSQIPLYEYTIPVHLGFGEGAYSDKGYSGITEDTQEVTAEVAEDFGWGWGELGFGDGPFGGSFVKTFDDVRRLLEAKNNSEIGSITIAKFDMNPKISKGNIFINKTQSRSKEEPFDSYDLFSSGVWHISKDETYSDIMLASGIDEYKSVAGIYFPCSVISIGNEIVVEFDISSLLGGLNTSTQETDDSFVLTSLVDESAFNKSQAYDTFIPDSAATLDGLTLFTKDGDFLIDINSTSVVSSDFKKIVFKFNSSEGNNVGLGFKGAGNIIRPLEFIKI